MANNERQAMFVQSCRTPRGKRCPRQWQGGTAWVQRGVTLAIAAVIMLGALTLPAKAHQIPWLYRAALHNQSTYLNTLPRSKGVHLSHSGLYLAPPLSAGAPQFISLYVDASFYEVESATVSAMQMTQRTWEQVHLECGGLEGGGIEACEKDDLAAAKARQSERDGHAVRNCLPSDVRAQESRLLFDGESCIPLDSFLHGTHASVGAREDMLESTTISFSLKQRWSTDVETHTFWLARLYRAPTDTAPTGSALWPLAGTAHARNDSTTQSWTGLIPNRISGLMQDPYLPTASKPEAGDPLNGVDLTFAEWSNGITIDIPTNPNDSSTNHPELEAIHAPVTGQIVWTGEYTLQRAPANHRNDETEWGVMIRDDWGLVYQLLGLNETAIAVQPGEYIRAGAIVGSASRTPLSQEPPCRHRPADPPKMDDDSRRYPFRRRKLKVRVARPDPRWTEWKGPLESGWQFYNPLDAFERAGRSSNIPPDPNPTQVFFAKASADGGLTPPDVFATSKDIFQPPVLSGNIEVIVGFDDFQSTPGDGGDKMDLIGLHALDWAAYAEKEEDDTRSMVTKEGGDVHAMHTCSIVPKDIVWRTAFEHSKLPDDWRVTLPKTTLLAHYVPTFTTGRIPLFKKTYASAFDEKARKLYYAPTRTLGALVFGVGGTDDVDGIAGAPVAAWDTRREANSGNGLYRFWVRGRSWFGNSGCFSAVVRLQN